MYSNIYNFSKWLSQQLEEQKITVAKLSKVSGVHRNTIYNYLAERCEPTYYNVRCIVKALGYELEVVKL